MDTSQNHHPDAARSRLRAAVAAIDAEIVRLPGSASPLATSWADSVKLLALGPEPEVRECPVCKHVGMRAARLCGHCWTRLPPFGEEDHAVK